MNFSRSLQSRFRFLPHLLVLTLHAILSSPLIGGRKETLTNVETTLNIENFFCVDNRLTANRSRIIALATDSFSHLNAYLGEFKKYLLLYSRDLLTDTSDLEKLTDVDDLRMHCARYTGQIKDIKGISAFKNFGIFELDQRCFDEVMSPLYLRLYGKICTHLPVLLSSLLAESNEICQEIMGTLLTPPEGTAGFVDYIYFIERCETVFLEIHDKLTTVDELLELISVYKIDTGEDEELWQRFKTVSEFMVNCKDAHSKKSNQKDVFIEKLSSCIDQDVYQVYREVTEIRAEITKEWILSEESQPVQVKETLSNALEQLQVSNEKLVQLQSYCEAMELELIDLSVFVDVQVEARVRLNLWESLEEWTNAIQDWYTQSFYQLNTEQMRLVNARVSEHCVVFESTLPENPIAPKLKASVELFKGKIEIISQLRNEKLKEVKLFRVFQWSCSERISYFLQRHWSVIEELIDRKITEDEEITIKDFEEVGVFEEAIARKLSQVSVKSIKSHQFGLKQKLIIPLADIRTSRGRTTNRGTTPHDRELLDGVPVAIAAVSVSQEHFRLSEHRRGGSALGRCICQDELNPQLGVRGADSRASGEVDRPFEPFH